ncbi:MAG: sporulation protein YqfD [Bacilli bacterium]|nr:sporulation protein YqfD [Bacilli bacterium]
MNTIILNIKGKNIDNFIYRLHSKRIELLNISYINRKEVDIEIYDSDYVLVDEIKGTYEITTKKYKGIKKVKNMIIYHKIFICSIILGIVLFLTLTNLIYDVEIVYSGNNMREMLSDELKRHGIKKYSFAKSFDELESIKNQILIDRKDSLEWLMIERVGTKYIVRLEPRELNDIKEDNKLYNVIVTKDVIIKKVEASSGEIVKNVNDYAKKGDVVISSDILLYDNLKARVSASGIVYGETWYKVNIEYPLNYYEEKETGNVKTLYNIKFLDRYIGFGSFKNKKIEDNYILKSDILPVALNKQTQREIEIINYTLGYNEALEHAKEEGRKKMKERLDEDEYIIDEKSLKIEMKDSKIVVDMFYTVYENVTGYIEIEGLDDIQQ